MVFGDFRNNNNNNNNNDEEAATLQNRWQLMRMANSMKILGRGVIRVVHRLDDAKENSNLGEYTYFVIFIVIPYLEN